MKYTGYVRTILKRSNRIRRYCTEGTNDVVKGVTLSNCKGTSDFTPRDMVIRNRILDISLNCFRRHGAVAIETPTIETKDLLLRKYANESKNIFNVQNDDEEEISFRYDMTVPLARYMATNELDSLKCFRVGKVYRRDDPAVTVGRYREFVQCDFDIAGNHDLVVPDVECLHIVNEILSELNINAYKIKINHRQILYGLFELCGIPYDKYKHICHVVDKLDKLSWDEVRYELIAKLELTDATVDKLGSFVKMKGQQEMVKELLSNADVRKLVSLRNGLEEIHLLLDYSKILKLENVLSFDLSLARGLDYYTGIIFEAVLTDIPESVSETFQRVGSIAGGGRYDDLISSFHPEGKSVPCVGFSIGVDRIFSFLNELTEEYPRTVETEVFVASPQKNFEVERMKLLRMLWDADIKAEMSYLRHSKFLDQAQHCERNKIPFIVIIAESELKNGTVKIRNTNTRKEVEVPRTKMVDTIKKLLTDHSFSISKNVFR